MLKQRWKPTTGEDQDHGGQHDHGRDRDLGMWPTPHGRNRKTTSSSASAESEAAHENDEHYGDEPLIKKRWFREAESRESAVRDRAGSIWASEGSEPALPKADKQAVPDENSCSCARENRCQCARKDKCKCANQCQCAGDSAGSLIPSSIAMSTPESDALSNGFTVSASGVAQQIVRTTLRGCANLPHLVPSERTPLLMSREYPSCIAWPSVLLVVIILAYYLSRPPRSRQRPSEFVIPSSSVFRNPERYTRLRKVSMPRLSADYVASEIEFRHPDEPAAAMKQLREWAYFPGNGWLAFLGLAPLLYMDTDAAPEDYRTVTAISFSSRTGGLTPEDAFEVDADILAYLGPTKLLIPSDATAGGLPQIIEHQLNVLCHKWLALTKDDELLDVSPKTSGLALYAAETIGCEVTCAVVDDVAAGLQESTARYSSCSHLLTVLRWDPQNGVAGQRAPGSRRILESGEFTKCSLLCPPSTSYLCRILPAVSAALTPRGTLLLCVTLLAEKSEGLMPPQTEAEHLRAFARHHILPVGLDSYTTGSSMSGWTTLAALTRVLGDSGFDLKWARSAGKDMGRVCEMAAREIIPSPMWIPSPIERLVGEQGDNDEDAVPAALFSRSGLRRRTSGTSEISRKRRSSRLSRDGAGTRSPAPPSNARQMRKRAWEFYLAWAAGAFARGVLETYWILAVKRDG